MPISPPGLSQQSSSSVGGIRSNKEPTEEPSVTSRAADGESEGKEGQEAGSQTGLVLACPVSCALPSVVATSPLPEEVVEASPSQPSNQAVVVPKRALRQQPQQLAAASSPSLLLVEPNVWANTHGLNNPLPNGVLENQLGDVIQVTQPASLPTSPLASPRPTVPNNSSTSSSNNSCSALCLSHARASTTDPNWQAGKHSMRERHAAMFNNELMADIHFIVGTQGSTQRIPAHKYVLATGSTVFYAMFYGGLADDKKEIEVPDVEPAAFLALLKYFYCDEVHLEADTVLATLYAAKKYIVPFLARACVSFLETSLTARNSCLLLSQSRLFEEPELMHRCWEVIDAQAEMALNSEGFYEIDMDTLKLILLRETLNIKESVLFDAVMKWAAAECKRRELEPTPANRRQVLTDALYLIRIPAMGLEDFANGAAQAGILSLQETTDIFLHYTARNKPSLQYNVKSRAGLKPQVCHRFQSSAYRSNQWRYRGRCDSIQFCVDKRIFIVGFGLYGSSNGATDYTVRIELKRLGRILAEHHARFFSDGSSNTFHVYFEHPIQVEPDTFYTASATLDGTELSYFGQEGMSEINVGNVTFQFQCSSESTNGTGVQGGQIPELIFYGPTSVPEPETNVLEA